MRKLLLLMALTGVAQAADFSDDDLCRVIGDSPTLVVPPRDRLFLEKKCACYGPAGCAAPGSPRDKAIRARLNEALAAEKQRQATEAAKRKDAPKRRAAADAKTEPLRKAYWACVYDRAAKDCNDQLQALQKTCEATGQYQAGKHLDVDACSQTPTPEQVKALEAEADERVARALAAMRAETDKKLEPQRAVYWSCVGDVGRLCDQERAALRRACAALGDLLENGTMEACAGPKR